MTHHFDTVLSIFAHTQSPVAKWRMSFRAMPIGKKQVLAAPSCMGGGVRLGDPVASVNITV